LTVDQDLLDAAGILPYETILCSNASNGDQFFTYVIEGKRRGGEITLNGPIARKGAKGDQLIIFRYEYAAQEQIKGWVPKIIPVDTRNHLPLQSSNSGLPFPTPKAKT
jgi:aspartate 1-decarboxylase